MSKSWPAEIHPILNTYPRLFIGQLFTATWLAAEVYQLQPEGHCFHHFEVTGVVRSKVVKEAYFVYELDDGTGCICVTIWKSKTENIDFDSLIGNCINNDKNGNSALSADSVAARLLFQAVQITVSDCNDSQNGAVLRVRGTLRMFRKRLEVYACFHQFLQSSINHPVTVPSASFSQPDINAEFVRILEMQTLRSQVLTLLKVPLPPVVESVNQSDMLFASNDHTDFSVTVNEQLAEAMLRQARSSHMYTFRLTEIRLLDGEVSELLASHLQSNLKLLRESADLLCRRGELYIVSEFGCSTTATSLGVDSFIYKITLLDRHLISDVLRLIKTRSDGLVETLDRSAHKDAFGAGNITAQSGASFRWLLSNLNACVCYRRLSYSALFLLLTNLEENSRVISVAPEHYKVA